MNSIPVRLFPRLLDSIEEGVFTVDLDFRVTYLNAAAERILGLERADALGRRCHEVFRATSCGEACALKRTVATGESTGGLRVDVLNAEQEAVPISISTAALRDEDGRVIGGVEVFRDTSEIEELRRRLDGRRRVGEMIGDSPPMRELFRMLPDLAVSAAPVLIGGESGTGKELYARALHVQSPRAEKPFVTVNAAALPDTLLESELFGYRKGAFTGALMDRPGRFQEADGGTLFLDEIGELSPAFQVKLLRALESGEVTRLGDNRPRTVDVRLVSATNRDLRRLVREGGFRRDLFYRISVLPVRIPPLRERRSDIPLLLEHFRRGLRARTGKPIDGLTDDALAALYDYDYPGNVRELRNILERAFVLCRGRSIDIGHLPLEVVGAGGRQDPGTTPATRTPAGGETEELRAALEANQWNRGRTARTLGISRTTLWRRMREAGLLEGE